MKVMVQMKVKQWRERGRGIKSQVRETRTGNGIKKNILKGEREEKKVTAD